MMKRVFSACFAGVLLCGCLAVHDPAAETALEVYQRSLLPAPEKLDLTGALNLVPAGKYPEVRRHFAMLKFAENDKKLHERSRIMLNCLLGYLPDNLIVYDTAGAWDCPAEVPTADCVEKMALMLDGGRTPAAELLAGVRLAHLEAVYHMNQLQIAGEKGTCQRQAVYDYFISCLQLAESVGCDLPQLSAAEDHARRFNAAEIRREKRKK
jgi:hypothetical protein